MSRKMSIKPITKKVINTPESCVDDNLRGVVAMYPELHLHPKHRVITTRNKTDTKRVAILGGGGSGHEPFAGGLVGHGMLDGAVAGSIFASPPTGHVLYAITHLYKYHSGGVMLVIGNYTGDRLNFGKAIEKARIAGIQVENIFVGEDVASCTNKTGGRGMVGEVVLYKMCGAMSAKGYDLKKIKFMATEIHKRFATLGVCLAACSLPGQPPLFEIAQDEMELGAGVHGEAGIAKMKLKSAKETVSMILDKVVEHLKLASGDRVAAIVNNHGSTSFMEMNIIASEIKNYFETKPIALERIFSGHFKASLEMHGFQICLLHLNKEHGDLWLELLDAPTVCPGWTGGPLSIKNEELNVDDDSLLQSHSQALSSGPVLSAKEQELLRGAILQASEELINNETLLNRLDSGCGDGDCGTTLRNFGESVQSYIKKAPLEYISNVLWDLSEIAETDMGGTSGGIYSLGLSAAALTIANEKSNNVVLWLSAWENAMQSITKYGGAEPGDRTMLDTLYYAAQVYRQHINGDFKSLLKKTVDGAENGAEATASMSAKAGRASYVSSDHLTDEDAGARAVAIWLKSILNFIVNNY